MKVFFLCSLMIPLLILFAGCGTPSQEAGLSPSPGGPISEVATPTATATPTPKPKSAEDVTVVPQEAPGEEIYPDVTQVSASVSAGAFSFLVTVLSPDTGCDQYADWWEVLTEDGDLIYRRVLAHSHTDEQPFTRSGSPVEVQPTQSLIVRSHMSTSGYGGLAMRGTVDGGFEEVSLGADFAPGAANQGPTPDLCAF